MNVWFFKIIGFIFPILFFSIFGFAIAMIVSPKLRAKWLSRNLKAHKHIINETSADFEDMISAVSTMGIKAKKRIYDENEDVMRDLARREANIEKEGIEIKTKAVKDALTKNTIYCKHCGESIDADSKFCKSCGKEQ